MATDRLADHAAQADSLLSPTQAAKVGIQLVHVGRETRKVGQVERRLHA